MISAIVFTYWPEEEHYIAACLKSVEWADEIIVIDNGATENTIEVVKKYTSKIYKVDNPDFDQRHNIAREKAKGDWLLYIDADERVSKELENEINTAVASKSEYVAYKLNRINFFLGKKVRYGDRFPDLVTRLFKRDNLEKWVGKIHESSVVSGKTGLLSAPLYHITHRDIFSMMQKTIIFSQHEAEIRFSANHPKVVGWRLMRVFISEFLTRIIKYQGWRQGTEGWIDGIFQSFSLFIVYARLWELQRTPNLRSEYEAIDGKILEGKI